MSDTLSTEETPTTPSVEQVGQHPLVSRLRKMRDIQGGNGNWNHDAYMHGMFNGMELMLATLEDREPEFRHAPDEWLADRPSHPLEDSSANTQGQRRP